ncbi:MAG: copper homeostasis protein CutC [Candidatus Fermentibacteraceae bacterium]
MRRFMQLLLHHREKAVTENTLIEACATTLTEARDAFKAGAHRIELCSALETGGLTPSTALLKEVLSSISIPVFVMVRNHEGPFTASRAQVRGMGRTIERLALSGANGFVLGVLDDKNSVDRIALKVLLEAAEGLPVTFHRAFDLLPDPLEGVHSLQMAGVARILTSGGQGTAWGGRSTLKSLVEAASGGLTVMAGGGVRAHHVVELIRETGVREIHARASAVPAIIDALRRRAGNQKVTGP